MEKVAHDIILSNLSFPEIANKNNVHVENVMHISNGLMFKHPLLVYPLRMYATYNHNIMDAFDSDMFAARTFNIGTEKQMYYKTQLPPDVIDMGRQMVRDIMGGIIIDKEDWNQQLNEGHLKPVPGYDGYFAQDNGYVYSCHKSGSYELTGKPIVLSPKHRKGSHQGYISMRANGRRDSYTVAKIIATTFIENPNDYRFVEHLDGDCQNNDVSNLVWSPRKEQFSS